MQLRTAIGRSDTQHILMGSNVFWLLILIALVSTSTLSSAFVNSSSNKVESDIYTENELIEEFTWAVTRYDEGYNYSSNFGKLGYPKPSWGTVLITSNFLSPELCKVALQIYHEDKMDTLNALVEFIKDNMQHIYPAMNPLKNEWGPPRAFGVTETPWRKEAAHEMFVIGKRSLLANAIGDCYGLASFYTSVLRLCGFTVEEVFNIWIAAKDGKTGHIANIIKVEDKWYYLDAPMTKLAKLGLQNPLNEYKNLNNTILWAIENDRYYEYFGDPYNFRDGYYSNMNDSLLKETMSGILQTLNYPILGVEYWDLDSFINNSEPDHHMLNVSLPYTVNNATGSTIKEKANSLAQMNHDFINNLISADNDTINQYTQAPYVYNLIDVDYPQAYANAAKYAPITSWYADKIDALLPFKDIFRTVMWIRINIKTERILNENQIAYSDLSYIVKKGSTLDQSIMAYGTLRNMKKSGSLWQPDDMFIVVTKDSNGYLAVRQTNNWVFLNFGRGIPILFKLNKEISFVFNEQDRLDALP